MLEVWRCDKTGNPVGTDTVAIGYICMCQGCKAGREIKRLWRENERLKLACDGYKSQVENAVNEMGRVKLAIVNIREIARDTLDRPEPR